MPLVASTNLLGSGAIKLLLAIGNLTMAVLSQRKRVCNKTITISKFDVTILKIFSILATTTFIIQKKEKLGNVFVKKEQNKLYLHNNRIFCSTDDHDEIIEEIIRSR